MKKAKRISALLLAVAMLFCFAACTQRTKEPDYSNETTTDPNRETKTKVASLDGPTGFGLAKIAVDRTYAYQVESYSDSEQIVSLLNSGEVDIASLPIDVAAKIGNSSDGKIKILSVNGLGNISCLQKGETVKSFGDIKGKTIYLANEGSMSEIIVRRVLSQNGIDPEKDVTFEYKDSESEIAELAIAGKIDFCILSEPFTTKVIVENEEYYRLIDFNEKWNELSETPLVQGIIVARTDYINENPQIISEFMNFNELSVNFITVNSESSAVFMSDNGYYETADMAYTSLSLCNLTFIEGEEMKNAVNAMLEVLYEQNPDIIGGKIPGDDFYYGI